MSRNANADARWGARGRLQSACCRRSSTSRPSGMRQRLAGSALARIAASYAQISNPAYPTPIPAQHVDGIFEICHFSPREKEQFLAAYRDAHHRRLQLFEGTSIGCIGPP